MDSPGARAVRDAPVLPEGDDRPTGDRDWTEYESAPAPKRPPGLTTVVGLLDPTEVDGWNRSQASDAS